MAYRWQRETERRTKYDGKESCPTKPEADQPRQLEEGLRDERAPDGANGFRNNGVRNEPESDNQNEEPRPDRLYDPYECTRANVSTGNMIGPG